MPILYLQYFIHEIFMCLFCLLPGVLWSGEFQNVVAPAVAGTAGAKATTWPSLAGPASGPPAEPIGIRLVGLLFCFSEVRA